MTEKDLDTRLKGISQSIYDLMLDVSDEGIKNNLNELEIYGALFRVRKMLARNIDMLEEAVRDAERVTIRK